MNVNEFYQIESLIQQLNSSDADVREETALKLAKTGDKNAANELLKRLSLENDYDVKQMIIYALGEIGSETAISTLIEYSKADDSETRWVAVEAIGKFTIPKANKILLNCLKTESDVNVCGAIIRTLANSTKSKLVKTLLLNLTNDENILEYQNIWENLIKFGIEKNFDNIIKLYQSNPRKKVVNNSCPKILIDASLILDILLERPSIFIDAAIEIVNLVLSKSLNGYIAERGLREIWHTYKELEGYEYANNLVILFLASFNFCKTDSEMIERAGKYCLSSFETAIQLECVKNSQIDAIITLRDRDFLGCDFPNVYSPFKFLDSYNFRLQSSSEEANFSLEEQKEKLNQSLALEISEVQENELFEGWIIEHFELLCPKRSLTSATVVILNTLSSNKDCRYSESAFGVGATATLFAALDKTVAHIVKKSHYILESIKVSNLEEGIEGSVMATVVVKSDKYKVRKLHIHKNVVKACFYAYVEAIKAIYDPDSDSSDSYRGKELSPMTKISESEILQQYNMGEREFSKVNLREANLSEKNLSEIDLRISDLSFSNLHGINLSKASLTEAIFTKAIVTEANLNESILCRAKLNDAILRNSKLVKSDLNKADLTKANLTNADLSHADLTKANLTNADLSHADLTGANLTDVNLSNAKLTGANFTNTTVDGANFSEANLSYADLKDLDLNNTVFCKPILTDTAMPQIKIEIYGQKRIEGMILLFSQFQSNHYEIFAVHSQAYGAWWNNEMGNKFREINRELNEKGVPIKRVFIIPKYNFDEEMKAIIREQVNLGIEVRCISEKEAAELDGFDLKEANFLICKNLSVENNSFTTMMLYDNKAQKEGSGYISFDKKDIKINQQRFNMIWRKAETYSQNLCGGGTKASC